MAGAYNVTINLVDQFSQQLKDAHKAVSLLETSLGKVKAHLKGGLFNTTSLRAQVGHLNAMAVAMERMAIASRGINLSGAKDSTC